MNCRVRRDSGILPCISAGNLRGLSSLTPLCRTSTCRTRGELGDSFLPCVPLGCQGFSPALRTCWEFECPPACYALPGTYAWSARVPATHRGRVLHLLPSSAWMLRGNDGFFVARSIARRRCTRHRPTVIRQTASRNVGEYHVVRHGTWYSFFLVGGDLAWHGEVCRGTERFVLGFTGTRPRNGKP
jgi:hypothetical protein